MMEKVPYVLKGYLEFQHDMFSGGGGVVQVFWLDTCIKSREKAGRPTRRLPRPNMARGQAIVAQTFRHRRRAHRLVRLG